MGNLHFANDSLSREEGGVIKHVYIEEGGSSYFSVNVRHFLEGIDLSGLAFRDSSSPLYKRYCEYKGGCGAIFMDIKEIELWLYGYEATEEYHKDSIAILGEMRSFDKIGIYKLQRPFDGCVWRVDDELLYPMHKALYEEGGDDRLLRVYIGRVMAYPYIGTFEASFLLSWLKRLDREVGGVDFGDIMDSYWFYQCNEDAVSYVHTSMEEYSK